MPKLLLPTMNALLCFEASARHLSFTRAAEELNLTQSAVSKQVAQLEDMLLNQLFFRVRKRGLKLTPAGELYLTEVGKILSQVDISSRYILSYGGEAEVLKIATQPTFGSCWLSPNLKGFSDLHPNIHLDVRSDLEPFDLVRAQADVAFFYGHGSWPGATCIELFGEEVVPVCSPSIISDHILNNAAEVASLPLLQCASRPEAWHEWFEDQGINTDNSYHGTRFDTFYMCIRAAKAGCGVALIPRFLVEEELADGKLITPWGYKKISRNKHFIAFPEHSGDVPKIEKFVSWILKKAESQRILP
ncbi:Transcriptional regulator, LysR family [Marinobacterium lacunae]|uniref:Transcriptional regulator, LysR family n=1 Tax=Marinobacterium lacunae TaxID=1232683 RepID=A0A081FYM2_9GAMM|nr:LysR substrate-binding domain-containing protein [Marinobacterium lacunae]KEA63627.1 Transcriptional regulator, LysR family [Marinobacterium lacunae]